MPTTRFAIAPILALLLATTVAMQSPRVTAAPPEVQPRLAAGPMPGHSAMRAVTVWLQGNTGGEVVLEYWPDGHPQQVRSSKALPLIAEQQFTAHIEIGGLEPGTG